MGSGRKRPVKYTRHGPVCGVCLRLMEMMVWISGGSITYRCKTCHVVCRIDMDNATGRLPGKPLS